MTNTTSTTSTPKAYSCNSCAGASCTCGCQATPSDRRAGCRCGQNCACGPTCTCAR